MVLEDVLNYIVFNRSYGLGELMFRFGYVKWLDLDDYEVNVMFNSKFINCKWYWRVR